MLTAYKNKAVNRILEGQITLEDPPEILWVELTSNCNLRCVMCPNSILLNKEGHYIEPDLFKRAMDQAAEFDPFVALFLGGESLMHKDVGELLSYSKKAGLSKVHLATNATLMDEAKAQMILDSGIDLLTFSFDGYDKQTYERARVGAKFEKTVANIERFLKMKASSGKDKPWTKMYSLDLDMKGEETFRPFLESFFGLGLNEYGVEQPGTFRGLFNDTKEFIPKLPGSEYFPCIWLWKSLAIHSSGRVVPCCADFDGELVLGDLREESILEIWNNDRVRAMRADMLEKQVAKYEICNHRCDSIWYETLDENGVPLEHSKERPRRINPQGKLIASQVIR
ncbi:MAG: radical SAM protein [Planctomycetes bacterium]|nr:radical SAM protein [Planctomycetota bacterium]